MTTTFLLSLRVACAENGIEYIIQNGKTVKQARFLVNTKELPQFVIYTFVCLVDKHYKSL